MFATFLLFVLLSSVAMAADQLSLTEQFEHSRAMVESHRATVRSLDKQRTVETARAGRLQSEGKPKAGIDKAMLRKDAVETEGAWAQNELIGLDQDAGTIEAMLKGKNPDMGAVKNSVEAYENRVNAFLGRLRLSHKYLR